MPMNAVHRRLCRSDSWAQRMRAQVLPWAMRDVPLDGRRVLELGPGYGITSTWLLEQGAQLTAVEVDPDLARALREQFGERIDVREGDGAQLPFDDGSFDVVVCYTMLHHVPSPAQQDRLFGEAARVLGSGGTFAGSDSRLSLRFRLLHIGDTMVPVDPDLLPERLRAAGFRDAETSLGGRSYRFRATR